MWGNSNDCILGNVRHVAQEDMLDAIVIKDQCVRTITHRDRVQGGEGQLGKPGVILDMNPTTSAGIGHIAQHTKVDAR